MILSVVYCHTHHKGYILAADLPEYAMPPMCCQMAACGHLRVTETDKNWVPCDAYVESHLKLWPSGEVEERSPLIDRSAGDWSRTKPHFYAQGFTVEGLPWAHPAVKVFFDEYDYERDASHP